MFSPQTPNNGGCKRVGFFRIISHCYIVVNPSIVQPINETRKMIQEYLKKAMQTAQYEMLEDNEGFYGSIPGATGVWATGNTLEECRNELLEVLEEWILIGVAQGHKLPEFDGVSLKVEPIA
ncbi:type II toxin-antitoxin system HicB family antitoxin [Limnoraphis robusta]|uniref:Type II toxin-antitoxin system HicB family antitoxin n=1 Tax=Limnoraphis robusta CCNP1315 TaxID=3110306 RepID=A0ABU5TY06_9CYAN|nr:type II toxin-antitoxin system HicB family antitoxin [Limnoraphis robusta]MEA5519827.1 type II toxin-antitoxin system HicB family antitoxin [Limnoraphis robusta CCNP1315]MEA5547862.1 type II toxin-antitoxin system HicB family antitoxin [Limnoraphis robusta CCNP1324]